MNKSHWTTKEIENLEGKTVLITGGSSGIGFEAAKVLASKGAGVILAVRNLEKGLRASEKIFAEFPAAKVEVIHMDLSDLESVKTFADSFIQRFDRLDRLINNAGVMIPPLKHTKQGFELQFGTNHLGHFALTGRLLPLLLSTKDSRVISVSSVASRGAKINFENLNGSNGYSPMKFYRQSKLCNLLFGIELNNRLREKGKNTISVVCHPGISATNLMSRGSGKESNSILKFLFGLAGQPAEKGAMPTLFATTNPFLKGGEYIGPNGRRNYRGIPAISTEADSLFNAPLAKKLWEVSENLSGVTFNF